MAFDPNARLDPSQVEDVRGGGIGGRTLALGGGGIGTVLLVVAYLLLGGNPANLVQPSTQTAPSGGSLEQCTTGAAANQREDCRIVGYVNSIQSYWASEFAAAGQKYQPADTVMFSDQSSTVPRRSGSASGLPGPKCLRTTSGSVSLRFSMRTPARAAISVTNSSSSVMSP